MKRLWAIVFALFIVIAASNLLRAQSVEHSVFQVSTIQALKQGMYDGETTFGELKKHGDFGLGTLDGLDGEMVALDGEFFQVKADGKVYPIADDRKTPFSVVTFFKVDKQISLPRIKDLRELQEILDRMLPSVENPCAIRIDGDFKYVKVRSMPRQEKPYPGLNDAVKHQTEFRLKNLRGTLVGYRFPGYMHGVNVPGYHFHFITADRKAGGHVLDCCGTGVGGAEVSLISELSLRLLKGAKDAATSR